MNTILTHPDISTNFVVRTDASERGIGESIETSGRIISILCEELTQADGLLTD